MGNPGEPMDVTPAEGAQHAHAHPRLTIAYFVHELAPHLNLEKGLLHTIVDLVRRPGAMLGSYFAGTTRTRYTNPIAYSLMGAAASLLAYSLYREPYVAWARTSMSAAAVGPQAAPFMRAYTEHMFEATQHTALNSISLAVPLALLLWRLFRSPRFNLAEAFAFALYAIGTFMFLHVVLIAPVLFFAHAWRVGQYGGMALQAITTAWLGLGVFGMRFANAAKLVFAFFASFAVWSVLFGIGVGIYTLLAG
jgi:hypothetical protein